MMKNRNLSRTIAILLVLAMLLPCMSMSVFSQDIPCVEEGCSGKYRNGICSASGHFEAAPTEEGVYRISNAGQLYWFAALVNGGEADADAVLTNDITINDMTAEDKLAWTPIGLYTSAREFVSYGGTFDGAGYTIYGLYYDNTNYDGRNAGLFGTLAEEGIVQNLNLADSVINGATEIGGIVSYNYGEVIGCTNAASVSGTGATGGIVCRNFGVVRDCSNTGSVSGATTGGIAAENTGEIVSCDNTGVVNGTNSVGGIVGMNDGRVEAAVNTANVTASGTHVGGVVGNLVGGAVNGSGNLGNVTGASDYIGGVAGVCSGATSPEATTPAPSPAAPPSPRLWAAWSAPSTAPTPPRASSPAATTPALSPAEAGSAASPVSPATRRLPWPLSTATATPPALSPAPLTLALWWAS